MRSFDPRSVGALECRAWETYYRRKWAVFLIASVGLVRAAFGMSWPRTGRGAWLVLRANQKWAPFPDNDPDAAGANDALHRGPSDGRLHAQPRCYCRAMSLSLGTGPF